MENLITFIAQSLVDNKDTVSVICDGEKDGAIVYKLSVASDDMGKIIGKQGRIAKALRTIVKAAAIRDNKKIIIDII